MNKNNMHSSDGAGMLGSDHQASLGGQKIWKLKGKKI
jgi:hypothetical protein